MLTDETYVEPTSNTKAITKASDKSCMYPVFSLLETRFTGIEQEPKEMMSCRRDTVFGCNVVQGEEVSRVVQDAHGSRGTNGMNLEELIPRSSHKWLNLVKRIGD